MLYIKAKFLKEGQPTGRSYTYKSADIVNPGEIVVDDKGSKLVVVDEPVDTTWIVAYGAEKAKVVSRYKEPIAAESEE